MAAGGDDEREVGAELAVPQVRQAHPEHVLSSCMQEHKERGGGERREGKREREREKGRGGERERERERERGRGRVYLRRLNVWIRVE